MLALCQVMGADTCINAIGGMELYTREEFHTRGIELKFIKSQLFDYPQFGGEFVPWLSIVDVMMFNSPEQVGVNVRERYDLV